MLGGGTCAPRSRSRTWRRRSSRSSRVPACGCCARPSSSTATRRMFLENTKKFTDATGVDVKVDIESWEDLRPKTAVAANVGSGPDIVLAWSDDPHKFAAKCRRSDRSRHLSRREVWRLVADRREATARCATMAAGSPCRSAPRAGGSSIASPGSTRPATTTIPTDLDGFLDLCGKLKANGHPAGFALGNAVGDANAWCHWVMWAYRRCRRPTRTTRSSSTARRRSRRSSTPRRCTRPSSPARSPGSTRRTTRPSSSGELGPDAERHLGLLRRQELARTPAVKAMAEDIYHARMPIGPVGQADRAGAARQPDGVQPHQVPERGQGVSALHDGGGAVRPVAERLHRLLEPSAAGLRRERRSGPPTRSTSPSRTCIADALWDGYKGSRRRGLGRGAGRLRRRADGGLGLRRPGDARGGGRGSRAPRRSATTSPERLGRGRRHAVRRPRARLGLTGGGHGGARPRRIGIPRREIGWLARGCSTSKPFLIFLCLLPAPGHPDPVPDLPLGPRRLARLHRHHHRPRRASSSGSTTTIWLFADPVFRLVGLNTLFYTIVATIGKFALGLWLALILNHHLPFKSFLRAIILIPFIVPTVLSAIAFWWIYDPQFSIISYVLVDVLGWRDTYIDFLGEPWNARLSLIAANIWRGIPFVAITPAGRPADHLALALRGGDARRRHARSALPPRHLPDADADPGRGADLLGASSPSPTSSSSTPSPAAARSTRPTSWRRSPTSAPSPAASSARGRRSRSP